MKKIITVLIALCLTLMSAVNVIAEQENENILINGDFENGQTGWTGANYFTVEEDENGNHYAATDNGCLWYQAVTLERDTWYHFSAKYKAQDSASSALFGMVTVKWMTNPGEAEYHYATPLYGSINKTSWTTLEGYYKFSGIEKSEKTGDSYDTINARIELRSGWNSTPVYLDDIEITKAANIANGDFEDSAFAENKSISGSMMNTKLPSYNTQFAPYKNVENVTISREAAHSGAYGAEVKPQSSDEKNLMQYISAQNGSEYEVGAWVKLKTVADEPVYASAYVDRQTFCTNADGERVNADLGTVELGRSNDISDGEWHYVTFPYKPADNIDGYTDIRNGNGYLYFGIPGDFYIDDIQLSGRFISCEGVSLEDEYGYVPVEFLHESDSIYPVASLKNDTGSAKKCSIVGAAYSADKRKY